MTLAELNKFRRVLEGLQAELAVADYEGLTVEPGSDEMDRIQRFSEREYAMNYLERNSNRLREVRAALRRMDEGTFGVCVDCEADINPRRLTAVPWTPTCIACQEAAERASAESGVAIDTSDMVTP
jgi:DnaK suppressor protein